MNFGSTLAFVPLQEETEPIYQDEVEDGIAACASAQAEIWATEAANAETGLDKEFLKEIFHMAEKSAEAHRDTSHHDAQTYHNGLCAFTVALTLRRLFEQLEVTTSF
jgi:hypothetical protein